MLCEILGIWIGLLLDDATLCEWALECALWAAPWRASSFSEKPSDASLCLHITSYFASMQWPICIFLFLLLRHNNKGLIKTCMSDAYWHCPAVWHLSTNCITELICKQVSFHIFFFFFLESSHSRNERKWLQKISSGTKSFLRIHQKS